MECKKMSDVRISDDILYIGVDDGDLDLFESQYEVPNGVSYNSYLIIDDKIAVMDTADTKVSEKWLSNLEKALGGRKPDYLVISHLEPDHAGNIRAAAEKYPEMKLVLNSKSAAMIVQFFEIDIEKRGIIVKEGEELNLGRHTLKFIMAPMVHWPEVMVEYEKTEKILFSADGFGKFGTLDTDEEWDCEARRYYFNIVGKYGAQVQALLKKAAALDIKMICPLHGPILKENLGHYIERYSVWSSYEPEEEGVFVAYASIHGNTAAAALKMAEILKAKGVKKIEVMDLAREDMAEAVENAFRYSSMILAAASYDAGVFPCMEDFLHHLKSKNYQNRKIGIIENGSWAPSAAKTIRGILDGMKNIRIAEPAVTIKSVMKDADIPKMEELAEAVIK
jgi:flavorubredoxin